MGGLDSRFSCVATGMETLFPHLLQAVKNVVGCGSVCGICSRRLVKGENCLTLQFKVGARN